MGNGRDSGAGCAVLESQTMTSDTFPHLFTYSPGRVPPIDLIIHSIQDALTGAANQAAEDYQANPVDTAIAIASLSRAETLSNLSIALTRAIDPGALAEHWADDGDADIAGAHLARRLTHAIEATADISAQAAATAMRYPPGWKMGDPLPAPLKSPRQTSNAEGRALETAVARRLADTACSLAITGDKEDAAQASALWQAAATLTGLLPPCTGDTLRAAADLVTAINGPSTKSSSNADKERLRQCAIDIAAIVGLDWEEGDNTIGTLQVAIATIAGWAKPMRRIAEDPADSLRRLKSDAAEVRKPTPRILQSADEAPCGSLLQTVDEHPYGGRVIMRWPSGSGWILDPETSGQAEVDGAWGWSMASQDFPARLIAEGLTEPECRHLSGLSAADAIAWCEQRDVACAEVHAAIEADHQGDKANAPKPRPQPGDVVPWAEVEDGGLYFDHEEPESCTFAVCTTAGDQWMFGPDDSDIDNVLRGHNGVKHGTLGSKCRGATLVARDLGSDPEAWRRAMREWTANGNKPPVPDVAAPSAEAATLALVRAALSCPGADDIVAHARLIKARAVENEHLLTSRDAATAIADRRLQALMQADERDSMVREHLGAGDTETTVDAAKRVAKERDDLLRRDPCSTCREDRRKAVAELEEANRQHAIAINAAEQSVAMAHKERDEAAADLKGAGRVLEKVRAALGWSTGDGMLSEFAADIAARLKTATDLASQRLDAITAMDKQVTGWGEKYQQSCLERDAAQEELRDIKSRLTNWVYCNPITGEVTQGLVIGHATSL